MPGKSIVYCQECQKEFPDYKRVGQLIKDQIIQGLSQACGAMPIEVFLGTLLSSPAGGGITITLGSYQVMMEFPEVERAHYGSRRDAINEARFPCPVCQKYSRWKRGSKKGR